MADGALQDGEDRDEGAYRFDDGGAYERFMGRWSRAAGAVYLDWMAPPPGARWLDVGCGTGSFTELIIARCAPSLVSAIDPEQAQIDHARHGPVADRVNFEVADARALPFAEGTFDIVSSALVLNFVPDPARALSEMRRVACRGGRVGGYVWDFAAERSPTWPFRRGLRQLGGSLAPTPGLDETSLGALTSLFEGAGLARVAAIPIDVTVRFRDFDDFWASQTPSFNPVAREIARLTPGDRLRLADLVRAEVAGPDGTIEYSARANAVSGSRF